MNPIQIALQEMRGIDFSRMILAMVNKEGGNYKEAFIATMAQILASRRTSQSIEVNGINYRIKHYSTIQQHNPAIISDLIGNGLNENYKTIQLLTHFPSKEINGNYTLSSVSTYQNFLANRFVNYNHYRNHTIANIVCAENETTRSNGDIIRLSAFA